MVLTVTCVFAVLGGSLILGVPLSWLLNGRRPLAEDDWLLAPFFGLAGALLVLHNLVYFDWTVAQVGPWLWVAAGLLWSWMLWSMRRAEDRGLQRFPALVFLVAGVVYCVHGLGLFLIGARDYLGGAWGDQYNYTATAQFLADLPYSTASLGQWPHFAAALSLAKAERIGVMLLQGFFASSVGADARTLFEPTILISPALLVLAIYGVGRRLGLGRERALTTAMAAGLLPGIALVHLYAWMAQALAIPFMIATIWMLQELATDPKPRRIFRAAILLAATTALYTEMVLVLLGLIVLALAGGLLLRLLSLKQALLLLAGTSLLTLALNPLYLEPLVTHTRRITLHTGDGGSALEFAYGLRGLGCLWVNDHWVFRPGIFGYVVLAYSLLMTGFAVLGLGVLCRWLLSIRSIALNDAEPQRRLLVAMMIALALLPVMVLLRDRDHPYQVAKLILMASPVLVLGVAHAGQLFPHGGIGMLGRLPLAALLAIALVGTGNLALRTAVPRRVPLWLSKDWREAAHKLGSLRGENLVLACGPGLFMNCWLAYAARHNNVWLANPVINNENVIGSNTPPAPGVNPLPLDHLIDLDAVPHDALLFERTSGDPQVVVEGDRSLIWSQGDYQLWRLGPGSYRLQPTGAARPKAHGSQLDLDGGKQRCF
jgi:hypothetical protein